MAPPKSLSDRKYPIWNKAFSYQKNNTEVVEVPLVFETNKVLLPNMQDIENTQEIVRIAKSRINKLLIFKKANGEQVVRIASIIPTPKYAKEHSYDISNVHPNALPQDFEGYMCVSDWGMNLKSFVRIEKGKMVENLRIVTSAEISNRNNAREYTDTEPCAPVWVPNYVWACAYVPTGDAVADAEHCQEIGHWVESGGDWQIPDCGSGGPDLLQECLQSNSPEACYCLIWGLACEDIGGGDEPPAADSISYDAIDSACLRSMVAQAISMDCQNKIATSIHDFFQNNATIHLQFFDNPILNDTTTDANTIIQPLSSPNKYRVVISFNNNALVNASQEYIAATILHEAMHAWINYTYPLGTAGNAAQHNLMAGEGNWRFETMKQALLELCPSLASKPQDLIDLTWGGLSKTFAYINLPASDRVRIEQTNLNYKNRTNNTGTPCN